jgi:phytoene synthase
MKNIMTASTQETDTLSILRMASADPDRMLCTAFMPHPARERAFVLLAFHNELLRVLQPTRSSAVAGSLAGMVRLQWWREVLEGRRPPEHYLAPRLLEAVAGGHLSRETLLRLVLSAEMELDRQASPDGVLASEAWVQMLRDGAGALSVGMGEILGVREPENLSALEWCGMAYGAGAMLRHWGVLEGGGRFLYPGPVSGLYQAGCAFVAQADAFIRQEEEHPAGWHLAALPLVLARRDLARHATAGQKAVQAGRPRGIGDKLAVMLAGWKAARRL